MDSINDWLAEWSKALVLGTSLFGGVGSNPTPVTFLLLDLLWGGRSLLSFEKLIVVNVSNFKTEFTTQKVHLPGIEPGTYRVLGGRHNQLDHRCSC